MIQQIQADNQIERDDRIKGDRDLMAAVARLQSLQKEEEETRVEQGERLGAAVESLQEAVRTLGPQREEILARCLEAVDQVRNLLSKEVVTRSAKEEALQEAVRDVRLMVSDETQAREAAVKAVVEALADEKVLREDGIMRERRMCEDEVSRSVNNARKAREEEERRLQEKLLEIVSAVSEERDLREESIRQERQKNIDARAQLQREMEGVQRESTKVAKTLEKAQEDTIRRTKEVDTKLADLLERCEGNRDGLAAEALKRETENRNLEQKALELQGLLSSELKERRSMDADLRKYLDAEIASRDESVASERRARESGDLQLAESWKAAVRDEREAREGEVAQVARELVAIKTQLLEETGKREDERSQQHLTIQKMRTDLTELQGERKVDVAAMREAFGQVTEELKIAQRARKEDIDRLDATMSTVSQRVDANAREARDKIFVFEKTVQLWQSEVQKEVDERTAAFTKLDARISEEHRFTESAVAAEAKARDDNDKVGDEALKQQIGEEARKTKVAIDKIAAQVMVLGEDVEKDRALHADASREVAKALASLQGALLSEEQARTQAGWQFQRLVDLLREEVSTETKERRAQGAALAEDAALLRKGLQQRDDRADSLANQLNQECNELRERLVREVRSRESGMAHVEQALVNMQNARDGTPAPIQTFNNVVNASESAERWRQADEEMERMRRAVVGLQSDVKGLSKSVANLDEGFDAFKTSLKG